MCAANIWHHVYILFSIMPLNCYHWRDSELSLWTEPGVWSGCYLEVLMEMALYSAKMEHFVWLLKVDSFLLHGTGLWTTYCKCFFSRTPGVCEWAFEYGLQLLIEQCGLTGDFLFYDSRMWKWIYLKDLKVWCTPLRWCEVGFELCLGCTRQPKWFRANCDSRDGK